MGGLLAGLGRHRVALFVLAILALLAWVLWQARGALPAFFIAVALAFILDPIVTSLQKRSLPRWAGVLIAYVAVVAVIWVLVAFAIPPLAEQTRELINRLPELGAAVTSIQQDLLEWYRSLPLPDDLRATIDESIENAEAAFAEAVRSILGPAFSTLLRTAGFILGLIVIPVWLFFVLKDREGLPRSVRKALPEGWHADADNVLSLMSITGGRWVRGQLLLGGAIFVATIVGLTILTLAGFEEFGRFTLVLALIAGVLEWFPIIGPIVAAIPAILIGLTISPAAAIAAAVLYTAIQQLENNLLVPKVLGDAVKLHPAVMILALVVGGGLFGIGGAILAAPVVAISRDLYRYTFERLHDRPPTTAYAVATGDAQGVNEPAAEEPASPSAPDAPEGSAKEGSAKEPPAPEEPADD